MIRGLKRFLPRSPIEIGESKMVYFPQIISALDTTLIKSRFNKINKLIGVISVLYTQRGVFFLWVYTLF